MASDLSELYQEVILDHNRQPRNFRALEGASRRAIGHNPLCGDKVTVYLDLEGDRLREITFQGSGCAISKASASMMTEILKGKSRSEAEVLFKAFHGLVTGDSRPTPEGPGLGKLVVFSGVSDYPVRVKCATLAWHTLRAALDHRQDAISTE